MRYKGYGAIGHIGLDWTPTHLNIIQKQIMSILEKLHKRDVSTKIEKSAVPQPAAADDPQARRPTTPCLRQHPGPTPPYGLHHWQDAYGNWRCTQCDPPATLAMVRDECLVSIDGDGAGRSTTPTHDAGPGVLIVGDDDPAIPPAWRGRWEFWTDKHGENHYTKV